MDDFINDEINSTDENEPVLLEINDLIKAKWRKDRGNKNTYLNSSSVYYYRPQLTVHNPVDDLGDYNDGERDDECLLSHDKISNHVNKERYDKKSFINDFKLMFLRSKLTNYYEQGINKMKNLFTNEKKKENNFFGYPDNFPSEYLNILATRLYYSKITKYIYFFVIILNIYILITTIFTQMTSKFVVISEIFVIIMLIIEVLLRLTTQGSRYFYHFDGLFDVVITIMCFLLLISSGDLKVFYADNTAKTKKNEIEEIISQSLTILRFSLQFFRTITLFMHCKRTEEPVEKIDFSLLNLPNDDA
ncbi:conserved Plasmodium protein, unknown function [Plasmodium vinckei lentum]|uniref:Ion transport domain-containing protein n=1 Tax=Plasmodium vinckei lentum TaxID=138297 RepID=A0A6V7S8L5_PLAVN|nr:conserved Plasmodium protein, unknown function [Plasmodium vinckei lentum]